ncbi:MAG: hypothetical protein QM786_16700 [Breznakibacter sp.]
MEKKLFPELLTQTGKISKIIRHRINYCGIDLQQERTWSKGGFQKEKKKDAMGREYYIAKNLGIINRGVMLNPNLYLAFTNEVDALAAFAQTVCFCRNEDLLFPTLMQQMNIEEFEQIEGFELISSSSEVGFKVGHNRFDNTSEMYGQLIVIGNPIRNENTIG